MAAKKKKEEAPKEKEPKIYTIPLRDAFNFPRKKRVGKAVDIVKRYLQRHAKAEEFNISATLNEALWARGIEKPPRKIRVKLVDEAGVLVADLVE